MSTGKIDMVDLELIVSAIKVLSKIQKPTKETLLYTRNANNYYKAVRQLSNIVITCGYMLDKDFNLIEREFKHEFLL